MNRKAWIGLALILAACSLTDLDDQDFQASGEAPAAAAAVFEKAEAWVQGRTGWQVLLSRRPDQLQLRRTLPGQNRTGLIDFTTAADTTTASTKYEIRAWTEILGIRTRQNDVEVVVDGRALAAALECPAAKWPTCP